MTTRLVFAVVPSTLYAGDATLDTLHGALASDLRRLHVEGLEATSYLESKVVCTWAEGVFEVLMGMYLGSGSLS